MSGNGTNNDGHLSPPIAERKPTTRTIHDVELVDDYAWMRERESETVLDHLRAENAYTAAMLGHQEGLRETLYKEMVGRIQEADISAPVRRKDHEYYVKTFEGMQYSATYRRKLSGGDEELILDQNALAEGESFFAVGIFQPSPDGSLLAYSTDTKGDEDFTIVVKDLATGELLSDRLERTTYSFAWAQDNATVFYSVLDEARRPYKIFRHRLGTDQAEDELVFHEEDERFNVGVGSSTSGRFIYIGSGSSVTSEYRVIPADAPLSDPVLIRERRHGIEYSVTDQGERFLIVTNDGAKDFRLMEAPFDAPGEWVEVIGAREGIKIESVESFANHIALVEREGGLTHIRIIDVVTGDHARLEMPEPVYLVGLGPSYVYDTTTLRFVYTSLTTPTSAFDHDMATGERTLVKQQAVLGGFDPDEYVTERITATASDGVEVPVSIVRRKDVPLDGTAPAILYGYGSYGISIDPSFSSPRLSFLDRGVVFAIAHVRGGGELGEGWRDDGKLLKKMNTFTDFIACAEALLARGYVAPGRLGAFGGSAGGLLMGAVVNLRPDLFSSVVAHVPFVDVVNTMLDPSIPLTVGEYEEWGNPNEAEFFNYIRTYSPYDNVEAKAYPAMLVMTGLNDPRVQYWEPAKWVAKLRAHKTDDQPLLFKVEMDHGHMGPSGRYDALREAAFFYAFLLERLGSA